MGELIVVQVCYALPARQERRDLRVPAGTTIRQAIEQSGILHDFPDIDLQVNPVGIFSRVRTLDTVLKDHDRVEIYRPLRVDPREARRRRVARPRGEA